MYIYEDYIYSTAQQIQQTPDVCGSAQAEQSRYRMGLYKGNIVTAVIYLQINCAGFLSCTRLQDV